MEFDTKTGRILCVGGVDESMHSFLLNALNELNQTKHKELLLILSTDGGDTYTALGIYDLLRNNTKPVVILANGPCQSAGTLILQAGSTRLATPHSVFLYHYGAPDVANWHESQFLQRMDEKWIEIISNRTNKLPRYSLEQMHRGETYLTANDSLELGLIDKITEKVM